MKISREAEAEIPVFSSHDEARKYFKDKYGQGFVMMSSEIIDDQKIYFYSLLLNPEIFYDGQKQLAKGEAVSGFEFMDSYQPVEIFEDGRIHIVH